MFSRAFRFSSHKFRNFKSKNERNNATLVARGSGSKKALIFGMVTTVAVGAYLINQEASAEERKVNIEKIKEEIKKVIEEDEKKGPTFVRLAWHASGSYDGYSKNGGSNGGTIRFQPEASYGGNAGLGLARGWLDEIKKNHPEITYADLFILAGNTAIEAMNGPKLPFRTGREDYPDGSYCQPDGRLPDADKGNVTYNIKHVRDIGLRLGFTDKEWVALIGGGHSIGFCHTDRSGYDGPWTFSPVTFSTEFFRLLVEENWIPRDWNGPMQYTDARTKTLMMLPSDIALLKDPFSEKWVRHFATNEEDFNKTFVTAWTKLTENGVPAFQKRGLFGLNFWPFK